MSCPLMLMRAVSPEILAVVAKLRAMTARKQVHEPETRVVAGDLMFGPRIAETDDDAQR